jgi:hypothetical protein
MRSAIVSGLVTALLLITAATACDDKDDAKHGAGAASASATTPTPTVAATSATAATTAPAAPSSSVAPPKCPAGLTGNPVPAYCIKLPASYKVKEARVAPKRGSIEYDTGSATDMLSVTYEDTSVAELAKQVEGEMKFGHDKLEKKGDLPAGNKWFQGSHEDYARIVTLFKGPAPLTLKCSFAYQPKKAPPQEAIDACKSIVVP